MSTKPKVTKIIFHPERMFRGFQDDDGMISIGPPYALIRGDALMIYSDEPYTVDANVLAKAKR